MLYIKPIYTKTREFEMNKHILDIDQCQKRYRKSAYLTKLIFCYVEVQVANIQPSSPSWVGACKSTWCHSSSWLNKILFSFRRFHHHWLTKEELSRECYRHRHWHRIIELDIPTKKRSNIANHLIELYIPKNKSQIVIKKNKCNRGD